MTDVIIIGSGPAGVSAALYAARAGRSVRVVSQGTGALEKAEKIENYYGFAEPVSGKDLAAQGIAGARRLGVEFMTAEVVWLGLDDTLTHYIVETPTEKLAAKSVIMATGATRQSAPVPGLAPLEGHGVSYCAICDAFFYRKKAVAVLGAGAYAVHEAEILTRTSASVTLCTDGAEPEVSVPEGIRVETGRVAAITGTDINLQLRSFGILLLVVFKVGY